MADKLEIRPLHQSEVAAVAALAREIWRTHYPGIISTAQIEYMLDERYSEDAIRKELERGDAWWDVLLRDGEMIGYTSYFWYGDSVERDTIKIDKLYLRERRQGHGARLIGHVAGRMAAQGCRRLLLAVNRQNKTAIAAYRKSGFHIADTSLKPIGGGFWMDDYIMIKDVNG